MVVSIFQGQETILCFDHGADFIMVSFIVQQSWPTKVFGSFPKELGDTIPIKDLVTLRIWEFRGHNTRDTKLLHPHSGDTRLIYCGGANFPNLVGCPQNCGIPQ